MDGDRAVVGLRLHDDQAFLHQRAQIEAVDFQAGAARFEAGQIQKFRRHLDQAIGFFLHGVEDALAAVLREIGTLEQGGAGLEGGQRRP